MKPKGHRPITKNRPFKRVPSLAIPYDPTEPLQAICDGFTGLPRPKIESDIDVIRNSVELLYMAKEIIDGYAPGTMRDVEVMLNAAEQLHRESEAIMVEAGFTAPPKVKETTT